MTDPGAGTHHPNIVPSAMRPTTGYYPTSTYPAPSVPAPRSARRSILAGTAAVGVWTAGQYFTVILAAVQQVTHSHHSPLLIAVTLATIVLAELALFAIVAGSAKWRRGAVVACLVVALFVRLVAWIVLGARLYNVSALTSFAEWASTAWVSNIILAVAFTLLMAAWYLGHRRNLMPLVLAPIGGAVAALACWGAVLALNAIWSGPLHGWGVTGYLAVNTTLVVLTLCGTGVAFAWLGALLDRSPTTVRPQ